MPRSIQQPLPPMELRKTEQDDPAFRTSEQDESVLRKAEREASQLFDQACEMAGLENKEIAHLLGVSVSLVEKWRSTEQRGGPSFVQMLLLPTSFHFALHKVMNRRHGYGREALREIIESLGTLSMVVER